MIPLTVPAALDCAGLGDVEVVATETSGGSASATFTLGGVVNQDTGLYFTTIQGAIDDAATLDGHTLCVGPGTYDEEPVVNKSLTITSVDGASDTIIATTDTGGGATVIISAPNVTFGNGGFTIRRDVEVPTFAGELVAVGTASDASGLVFQNNVLECTVVEPCTNALGVSGGEGAGFQILNNEFKGDINTAIKISSAGTLGTVIVDGNTMSGYSIAGIRLLDPIAAPTITNNSFSDGTDDHFLDFAEGLTGDQVYAIFADTGLAGFTGNTFDTSSVVVPEAAPTTVKSTTSFSISATIQGSIDAAADGDIVVVGDGTYVETVDVNKSLTVTSLNGTASTIIDGSSASGEPVVDITANNVTFGNGGFTVLGGPTADAVMEVTGVSGAVVQNNILDGAGETSVLRITGNDSTGIDILNNQILNGGVGIILRTETGLVGLDDIEIDGNTISGHTVGSATGIFTASAAVGPITNLVITNNAFSDNTTHLEDGAEALTPEQVYDIFNSHIGSDGNTFDNSSMVVADRLADPKGAKSIASFYIRSSIQDSIDDAAAGDQVEVGPGTGPDAYLEQVVINKALYLISTDGAAGTTIDTTALGVGATVDVDASPVNIGADPIANGFTITGSAIGIDVVGDNFRSSGNTIIPVGSTGISVTGLAAFRYHYHCDGQRWHGHPAY